MYTDLKIHFDNCKPITENSLSAYNSFQKIDKADIEKIGLRYLKTATPGTDIKKTFPSGANKGNDK